MTDMDTLDKTTFENGMRQLMQRLDKHEEVLYGFNGTGKDAALTIPKLEDELLDNQDLCLMLHVSKRTLQRYRSSGMLPYRLLKRKPYYKRSDVENFIRTYAREIKKENDGKRKARIYV